MSDNVTSSVSDDFWDELDFGITTDIEEEDKDVLSDNNLKELMKVTYNYPDQIDPNFQEKIYNKREFYYHKIPNRPKMNDYNIMKEFRDTICRPASFGLLPQQAFASNYINPDTPFKGLLLMHGTGVGKCLMECSIVPILCDRKRKHIKIHEIWDNYNSGILIVDETDNGQWSIPKTELYTDSYDTENHKIIHCKILKLYRQPINEMMHNIILENGSQIKMTKQHHLLKKMISGYSWENNFDIGDEIYVYDNDDIIFSKIKDVKEYYHNGYVYDLEVEKYHNYIANGMITHNTCAGIAIAERFKPLVQKYGTKIYVLVSGPIIKENWKDFLLSCTNNTYLKQNDASVYMNEQDRAKAKKNAVSVALQFYRFMSYRSFYKKVLGEKIQEKVKTKDNKVKIIYRKTEEGDFERDISVDRIYNLNNSLIIIDEAHNLTGNNFGEALMKVIRNSYNLKVVLLTATPMKNLADDVVELLNFLRPPNDPVLRDRIFTSEKNHAMRLKPGGIEYLKEMASGYVSYLRGADPLTFAKRIEMGVVPPGLLFTKIVQCKMLPFQRKIYDEAIKISDDTLDRRSEAVANFAFPGINDKKELSGYYGREGINSVKNQLKGNLELINKKIALEILKDKTLENDTDLLYVSDTGKSVTGKIFRIEYLKYFSIKFYKALKKVNRLVWGKKGARTGFVYSNLVKVGIEVFQEILLANGYLEYDDNPNNYKIRSTTRCYFCGKTFMEHQQMKSDQKIKEQSRTQNVSESSSEYEKVEAQPPEHTFSPATFVVVTGKSTEEGAELIPEEKQHILRNIFSSADNLDGKLIKLVLGSKVINEGISLFNVAEIHILDVYFNLGKVDQILGRGIRHCGHYLLMSEQTPFPSVKVYKYAVTLGEGLSSEEDLYKKAEQKYLLIKKVERALKESAVDCPGNRSGNIFPEELEQFKNCAEPGKEKEGQETCPALCDYMECNFKCDSKELNNKYFNEKENNYRQLSKKELDYSTFTQTLAKSEIESAKSKIKELYRIKYLYTLKDIINYVRNSYQGEKKELFDDFFVFEALQDLTPITENDFNNFKDTIFDKFNRQGYLIYINKYYIYQPFDQNENVPMYHRSVYDKQMQSSLTLYNYLKNVAKLPLGKVAKQKKEEAITEKPIAVYDFDSVMDYYDSREEFKYVGIVDKESSRRKTKSIDELADVFKIRDKRPKVLVKKRDTGLSSIFGSVCSTSKSREVLEEIAKYINVKTKEEQTRFDICELLKEKLLLLEKYSVGKQNMTYVMIPANHPIYPFPYNLENRFKMTLDKIKDKIKFKIDITDKKHKIKVEGMDVLTYSIEITNTSNLAEFAEFLQKLGFRLEGKKWIMKIE